MASVAAAHACVKANMCVYFCVGAHGADRAPLCRGLCLKRLLPGTGQVSRCHGGEGGAGADTDYM